MEKRWKMRVIGDRREARAGKRSQTATEKEETFRTRRRKGEEKSQEKENSRQSKGDVHDKMGK